MKIPGDKIFVVICHDRHCDDGITVHVSRAGADGEIEKFKANYKDHEWTEHDYGRPQGWVRYVDSYDYGRPQGWVRYVDSYDDGPSARIQEVELRP